MRFIHEEDSIVYGMYIDETEQGMIEVSPDESREGRSRSQSRRDVKYETSYREFQDGSLRFGNLPPLVEGQDSIIKGLLKTASEAGLRVHANLVGLLYEHVLRPAAMRNKIAYDLVRKQTNVYREYLTNREEKVRGQIKAQANEFRQNLNKVRENLLSKRQAVREEYEKRDAEYKNARVSLSEAEGDLIAVGIKPRSVQQLIVSDGSTGYRKNIFIQTIGQFFFTILAISAFGGMIVFSLMSILGLLGNNPDENFRREVIGWTIFVIVLIGLAAAALIRLVLLKMWQMVGVAHATGNKYGWLLTLFALFVTLLILFIDAILHTKGILAPQAERLALASSFGVGTNRPLIQEWQAMLISMVLLIGYILYYSITGYKEGRSTVDEEQLNAFEINRNELLSKVGSLKKRYVVCDAEFKVAREKRDRAYEELQKVEKDLSLLESVDSILNLPDEGMLIKMAEKYSLTYLRKMVESIDQIQEEQQELARNKSPLAHVYKRTLIEYDKACKIFQKKIEELAHRAEPIAIRRDAEWD